MRSPSACCAVVRTGPGLPTHRTDLSRPTDARQSTAEGTSGPVLDTTLGTRPSTHVAEAADVLVDLVDLVDLVVLVDLVDGQSRPASGAQRRTT